MIYQGGGYSVTVDESGAIKVRAGDSLSKYSKAMHGDFTHINEFGRMHSDGVRPVQNVNVISAGETLYHIPTWKKNRNGGTVPPALDKNQWLIEQIPGIMRHNGWARGATFMDKWFNSPSHTKPSYGSPDTTTIKMHWVLSYARANLVYETMKFREVWVNDAGKREIAKMMKKHGFLRPGKKRFIDLTRPARDLNQYSTQFRSVGYFPAAPGIDDMFAALARFNLKVVVSGETELVAGQTKKYRVTIDEVGIYAWDTYDFNDSPGEDQWLGYWNAQEKSASILPLPDYVEVNNSDYRLWRKLNGKGGDFLAFSDVNIIKLSTPNVLEIDA